MQVATEHWATWEILASLARNAGLNTHPSPLISQEQLTPEQMAQVRGEGTETRVGGVISQWSAAVPMQQCGMNCDVPRSL